MQRMAFFLNHWSQNNEGLREEALVICLGNHEIS